MAVSKKSLFLLLIHLLIYEIFENNLQSSEKAVLETQV